MTRPGYISYSFISALLLLTGPQDICGQTLRYTVPALETIDIPASDTIEICILGDMMMHQAQIASAATEDGSYDFSSYFRLIEEDIREADIAVANMEFTLAGEPYSGYPCFSAPESFATSIADCGFDIFLTANNHIFDKGAEGAARTMEIYRKMGESHGIRFTGLAGTADERTANHPLTIGCRGVKISMINFTYGTNLCCGRAWPQVNRMSERNGIIEALESARSSDLTIVLPHWGDEYVLKHSESQRNTAEWLMENGADIIVGSHPHVVQDHEVIEGRHVIYSLGNAVSNMSAANTQLGLMVTLRIIRQHNGRTRMEEPEFRYLWCSRPGGYCSRYTVIPVKEFIGTRVLWQGSWEYDKMVSTYDRVAAITGIKDNSIE